MTGKKRDMMKAESLSSIAAPPVSLTKPIATMTNPGQYFGLSQ